MKKSILHFILFITTVSAATCVVTNQNVEAFHERWRDWNRDNFVERWYEERFNPVVQAAIIAQGQLMNAHLITCMDILNQTDGSANCDRTNLSIQKICIDHFYIICSMNVMMVD